MLHEVAGVLPAALGRCHDLADSRAEQRVALAEAGKRRSWDAAAQQRPQRRENEKETVPDQDVALPGNWYRRLGDGQVGRLGQAIRDGGDSAGTGGY